jgi:hypothetical protein
LLKKYFAKVTHFIWKMFIFASQTATFPYLVLSMQVLKFSAFALLSALVVGSCNLKPDFPKEPVITSLKLERTFNPFGFDEVTMKVGFQDGDGDLGITSEERATPRPLRIATSNQPFQEYKYTFTASNPPVALDSVPNPYYYNMFVKIFRKNGFGEFEEVVFPTANFSYNTSFPPLYEGTRRTPMEGSIDYTIQPLPPTFNKNDFLRIQVQLVDRNRNMSNIVSDTITLKME